MNNYQYVGSHTAPWHARSEFFWLNQSLLSVHHQYNWATYLLYDSLKYLSSVRNSAKETLSKYGWTTLTANTQICFNY